MKSRKTKFRAVKAGLSDLLGKEYIEAVSAARSYFEPNTTAERKAAANEKIDFFPASFQQRLLELLPEVGNLCRPAFSHSIRGAGSSEFHAHTKAALAPLSGYGYYRLSEDGRLFLISKSEHYHVSLGHSFPGYRLIENAKKLGIPNATHNNTRGHITRLLEEELVRTAAGIESTDRSKVSSLLESKKANVLNRVINLETGSLAAEAAIKLILSRFYKPQGDSVEPKYKGQVPVLAVLGDDQGSLQANYHGTTVVAQMMRGMWPDLLSGVEKQNLFRVRCVRPNRIDELEMVFEECNQGKQKTAGMFFELVMMNYGATRLTEKFVKRMAALCKKYDTPMVVDEIQTCIWSPEFYIFREYGLQPQCVVLGKGFPGGEYASSRILFSQEIDTLPQFGALVTNGQEELASLAYLVTMRWAEANRDVTAEVGQYYEDRLRELQPRYPHLIESIEGRRHLAGVYFHDLEAGKKFTAQLNRMGLDISVQTYKDGCPPSALTKLPLIAGYEVVDAVIERMSKALEMVDSGKK